MLRETSGAGTTSEALLAEIDEAEARADLTKAPSRSVGHEIAHAS